MKIIQKPGLYIFLLATTMLLSTLFISQFTYQSEFINELSLSDGQRELLKEKLKPIEGISLDKHAYIHTIGKAIDEINDEMRGQQSWDLVIYGKKDFLVILVRQGVHGPVSNHSFAYFLTIFGFMLLGGLMYIITQMKSSPPGIKNNHIMTNPFNSRGWAGILAGVALITFYIILYWFPAYLIEWILMLDGLSLILSGSVASHWFVYGFLYTFAVLVMGTRFILKYRHNRYQMIRTGSVMFFQFSFAFIIPNLLYLFNRPSMDFKNIWPLDYTFFFEWRLNDYISHGTIGYFMLGWGTALAIVGVPLFTYFFGKRWYCSWVCGCGGLAETAGDPFRHLSNKTIKAWKIERILIYSVLVFAVFMTIAVLATFFSGNSRLLWVDSYKLREVYGFLIGSVFAGVVGTGFYPLMGNRVWCRFGCPLAAYMGIVQRFKSRFRITVNGGQCISCGNCSTYCEMGIDVRSYAQKGQNVVRASCVGCGICAAVCPRGVLKLENSPEAGRIKETPTLPGNNTFQVKLKKVIIQK